MKLSVLAAVAALAFGVGSAPGCKKPPPATPSGPPAAAARYTATRWVPAAPTYVLASPSLREAQRAFRELIEVFGMPAGLEVAELQRAFTEVLGVDPLSPEAVGAIGVDLEGGAVLFSENITVTYVVRLAAPAQMQAFLDAQRKRGLVTQSVMVENIELFTARLAGDVAFSWAIADGWMWLHMAPPSARSEGTDWFSHSYRPEAPAWAADWQWAEVAAKLTRPALVGFIDAKQLLGRFVAQVPDALQCAKLLDPVQRVAFGAETDGTSAQLRLALDVGASADAVAAAQLPVSEGFDAMASRAPLAVQWNLDLFAVRAWLQPCLSALGQDLAGLDVVGVRAGRAALMALDADDVKKGSGVVALDLTHDRFLQAQLDNIPMRSTLERSRRFGPHAGHSISIPFVTTVDYVVKDRLALAGVGDGLLAKVVGTGKTVQGPVAAIDVLPQGLSAEAWKTLAELVGLPRADRVVERMQAWKQGHFKVEVEPGSLVFSASGTRR